MRTGAELLAAGKANQTEISGGPVQGPVFDFAPVINQFLQAHLFGAIFERDNLDWQSRELATVGALGLDSDDRIGFDIATSGSGNPAFASLTVAGVTRFYTINLGTGAATLVGTIGGGLVLTDIAVVSDVIFRNGFE